MRKLVEIGLSTPSRTLRLLDVCSQLAAPDAVRYVAIDLFEARTNPQVGLSLKEAHRVLKAPGAQVQLIPGDPKSALARSANSLSQVDLILISAEHDVASVGAAWFYVPRLLHAHTRVFLETRDAEGRVSWRAVPVDEIARLAAEYRARRAA